jgi:hypothetical protein
MAVVRERIMRCLSKKTVSRIVFVFLLGSLCSAHALPAGQGTAAKKSFQPADIAVIGPYAEKAEIAPTTMGTTGLGTAVSISGNSAVASTSSDGGAVIYGRAVDGYWMPETTLANDGFSTAAIDGDTVVVGLPNGNGLKGQVSVYTRSGTAWSKQQDLSAPGGKALDRFGDSVGLSGNTLVVGAAGMNDNAGAAFLFIRAGSSWTLRTQLSPFDGASGDLFGYRAAIAGDSVVIGAPSHGAGAAYLFTRSGTTWTAREEFNGDTAGDNFGSAVAISGTTIAIGAPFHDGGSGRAYVYTGAGDTWSLQKTLSAPTLITDGHFGFDVGLSGDRILIGEPGNAAAHVFTRAATTWTLRAELGNSASSFFGYAVALSGTNAVIGAPEDQTRGRAYIFDDIDDIFANGFN